MEGGTGVRSYARNSDLQASMFGPVMESISKAVENCDMSLFEKDVFRITDMGCSSTLNTVYAVEFVMNVISDKLKHAGGKIPNFQVYFSDLKVTDFNTLFKFLPEEQGKPYFYAAAPGSFFKKLFPDSSIHFGMCNVALHFLSKVPHVVNDGKVLVDTGNAEAYEKFKSQARDDLHSFLSYRLQEMVPGGLLSLMIPRTLTETEGLLPAKPLELAWKELIDEGLASAQTLDSFNLPICLFRSTEDVEPIVTEVGGFEVLCLDYITYHPPASSDYGRFVASATRAVFGPVIAQHLGKEHLVDELFRRYEANVKPPGECTSIRVILKKKDN